MAKKKYNDLGIGEKAAAGNFRTLNKDGTFNVRKANIPFWERVNFFHSLVTMPRLQFIGLILVMYFIANVIFATIYCIIGVDHLTGIESTSNLENFYEAFFFSAQTITTLGYGRVAPIGLLANIVAATESMIGLLSFALATGLIYGRFSKPSAKIKYSEHAVIAPYDKINGFMFRLLNPLDSQLLEVEVKISVSLLRKNSNLRTFHNLKINRYAIILQGEWS